VPPLSFGEDRVEGEGGLARAGDPGDHDQPVARDVAGDVAQVVLAGAADAKEVHRGEGFYRCAGRRWAQFGAGTAPSPYSNAEKRIPTAETSRKTSPSPIRMLQPTSRKSLSHLYLFTF